MNRDLLEYQKVIESLYQGEGAGDANVEI